MKVNDILKITESGTVIQIYDSKTAEIVADSVGAGSMLHHFGDREVIALNTTEADDYGIHFELVVR
jgi:hypothetical protein